MKKKERANNLPESTRGNIQKILRENPIVENKRKVAHRNVMIGNINALKHGKHVSASAFLTCSNCSVYKKCPAYQKPDKKNPSPLCAFSTLFNSLFSAESFDIRDSGTVIESFNRVTSSLLQRLARGVILEQLNGIELDISLTPVYKLLNDFMKAQHQQTTTYNDQPKAPYQQAADEIQRLQPEQRKIITDAISKALKLSSQPNVTSILPDVFL